MVLRDLNMDDDDDLEALRLAALQTIRPRASRNISAPSTNDKAKFFRPSNNPNLITIVPLDSRVKVNVDKPVPSIVENAKDAQNRLAKILPQSVYTIPKKEERNEVSSKFSRFRDSGSHSDDDSWDDDETFIPKRIERKISENETHQINSENNKAGKVDDGDDDSLEKLMDEMEEEFNKSEPIKDELEENSPNIKVKIKQEKIVAKDILKSSIDKIESDDEMLHETEKVTDDSSQKINSNYSSKSYETQRRKSPRRSPYKYSSLSPPDDHSLRSRRSPVSLIRRSPYKRSRSPVRRSSRSPKRYSPRMSPPRRRSLTPRRRIISSRSPSPRSRSRSPKRWYSSPKRQSLSPWRRSLSPKRRSLSPRTSSISPRRLLSPSPRRGSLSPRRRSISPRRISHSPKRKSLSPRRRLLSPRRSLSPRRTSRSPRQRSPSPRRRSFSPSRKSPSPRRRRKSPHCISPREIGLSKKRGRSPRPVISPKRQSLSPRRRKVMSPKQKTSPRSPIRRRSVSPRRLPRSPPRRSPVWSPPRNRSPPEMRNKCRKLSEEKRSPLNISEGRGKIQIKRRSFNVKSGKMIQGKHDTKKKGKEQRKKVEKKVLEESKSESHLNPILEARRKKFESNSVVAPINKKIRLCPVNNQNSKQGSETGKTNRKKLVIQKKSPLKDSMGNESNDVKKEIKPVKDDSLSPDPSNNDILYLEADYTLDDIEETKEREVMVEPTVKMRKAESRRVPPAKKMRKVITLNEDRHIIQKRKINVHIKPTALLLLEQKSKKLSEHKISQEKKEKNLKNQNEKSSSEDLVGKKIQQRQLKIFKETEAEVINEEKDKESTSTGDSKAPDLRAELSRRRAERMKGGINPASRLLQSAFEGLIGKKSVRTKRLASPEIETSLAKKPNVSSGKGRRVKVVQHGNSPLDSEPQELEYSNENARDSQRNTHLNSQSGRSILHRNQV